MIHETSRARQSHAATGTKERILEAAERLFAENGVGATSLRSIIAAADVNLAAVHYHYGSKEDLLKAVIHRHAGPMNKERLDRLDALEHKYGRKPIPLEELVRASIEPIIRMPKHPDLGHSFVRLLGRILAEPHYFGRVAPEQFAGVRDRFVTAFRRTLPELPPAELFWRIMFAIGAIAHTMRVGDYMTKLSGGLCREATVDETVQRLVEFLVAGLRARHKEVAKQ